jgi:hypothetical protein
LIGRDLDAEPTRPSMDDHPTGGHFQHAGIPSLERVVTDVLVFTTAAAAVLAVDREVHPPDGSRRAGWDGLQRAVPRPPMSSCNRPGLMTGVGIRTREES